MALDDPPREHALRVAAGAPAVVSLRPTLRAVVFDLDGVLTDTAELHYRAWQRLADEEGLPFDRAAERAAQRRGPDGQPAP